MNITPDGGEAFATGSPKSPLPTDWSLNETRIMNSFAPHEHAKPGRIATQHKRRVAKVEYVKC